MNYPLGIEYKISVNSFSAELQTESTASLRALWVPREAETIFVVALEPLLLD